MTVLSAVATSARPAGAAWTALRRAARRHAGELARSALGVAGLALLSVAAWDLAHPAGLAVGGLSLLLLEHRARM